MKVDFNAIKASTDIVAVVESYGVKLEPSGIDHVGLCPFHQESTPSFRVTRGKGLFHCFGCGVAGNVIQFVAKREGITERESAMKLLTTIPGVQTASALPVQATTTPTTAPTPMALAESAKLLQRVVSFYAKTIHKDPTGLEYLRSRKLDAPEMLDVFQVGFSNGTLASVLPKSGEILDQLKALGILNDKGHEHFYGCVTVPLFDPAGQVVGLYGRRVDDSNPHHLYMQGPRRGLWNRTTVKANQTLLVAESILDAMALWQAGFKNTIAIYGTNGWTPDHSQLLKDNAVSELILCLDNDEPGRIGTLQLKEKLGAIVKTVRSITWPDGVKDACDFFLSRGSLDFQKLLDAINPQPPPASANPTGQQGSQDQVSMTSDGFNVTYVTRRYELRGIEKSGASRLKATIRAVGDQGRFVIDTVDFYLSRSRRGFMTDVARLFHETVDVIETDLNKITTHLESYATKDANTAPIVLVSDADKAEGLKLGRNHDLTAEILRDLDRFGLVGELTNKLIGYLAMTSRKMDDPLSLLILSGSGAGKSLLQDTLLRLCPEEDLIKLTSLTGEALFYMGQDALKHKVLALEEHAGAQEADYAIRNLISAKRLVKEATIKDPLTGKLTTMRNVVDGPCAVFKTTTRPDMDAETKSRFIITSIDESSEQTKAILEAQRHSHTLEGIRSKKQREQIVRRHHAFQRLLKPVTVVNPYEPLLTYADKRLLVRRDNPKYLHLILAVTFLCQLQRPVKHDPDAGDYIETTLDDVAIANDLATDIFGQSLGELSRPSRELLKIIRRMVEEMEQKKVPPEFSRRQIREFAGWSDYQIKIHVKQLEELEYLVPLSGRRGQCFSYRLAWEGEGLDGERFVLGLISVEELRQRAKVVGLFNEQVGPKINLEGSSRVQVGLSQNGEKAHEYGLKSTSEPKLEGFDGEHVPDLCKPRNNGALVVVPNGEDHP